MTFAETTHRLVLMLAEHLREEPGEANGNMPAALQEEVARTHADWDARCRALRLLIGWRLVEEALEALDG